MTDREADRAAPVERCPICGGETRWLFSKDHRALGRAEYRRCSHCSFVHSDHIGRADRGLVDAFYRDCSFAAEDAGYLSRARTAFSALQAVCRRLGIPVEGLSLLDYGCGEGTFLTICRDAGVAARGYEPYARDAKTEGLLVSGDELERHGRTFDFVTSFEVVEHAAAPDIFATLIGLLRPGGYLLFSTGVYNARCHDERWEYFAPAHCSIYSVKSLQILAERLGVHRVFLLRHPFVDIPYLLTGEVWRRGGAPAASMPDGETVERIDAAFATAPRFLKKRIYRAIRTMMYRRACFV